MEALKTIREIDDEIIQTVEVFRDQLEIECMYTAMLLGISN